MELLRVGLALFHQLKIAPNMCSAHVSRQSWVGSSREENMTAFSTSAIDCQKQRGVFTVSKCKWNYSWSSRVAIKFEMCQCSYKHCSCLTRNLLGNGYGFLAFRPDGSLLQSFFSLCLFFIFSAPLLVFIMSSTLLVLHLNN